MKYLIEFLLTFVLVLLFYNLVEFRKLKKCNSKNLPVELKLFLKLYNVDVKKISYERILWSLVIIIGIDAGLVVLITEITSSLILKIVIALPSVFIVLLLSFKLLGLYYLKKGMIRNES